MLGGDQNARGLVNTVGYNTLLNLISKNILHELAEWFEAGLLFLLGFLLFLSVIEVEAFFCAGDEFLSIVLLHLLDHVLIDWVNKVENLVSAGPESFKEWRGSDRGFGLTSDVVDTLLAFLHACDVVLEGNLILTALGGVESEQISDLLSVGSILMDSEFKIFRELFIEFLIILLILSNLSKHLKALLDDILLHDLKDFVLLESLTRDVEWQVLRVDDTLDEREPVWDNLLAVIHDKDSTDIEFDVVLLLLGLKEIEWSSLWNEEKSAELKGTFNIEVLEGEVSLPIVGETLVEVLILFLGDLFRLSHPDWLDLVESLELICDLLDLLGFFLLLFLFLDFLNLWFLLFTFLLLFSFLLFFFLLLLFVVIRVGHFLFSGFFDLELNWESNELRVLFDKILESALLKVLLHIVLKLKDDSCSSGD